MSYRDNSRDMTPCHISRFLEMSPKALDSARPSAFSALPAQCTLHNSNRNIIRGSSPHTYTSFILRDLQKQKVELSHPTHTCLSMFELI